MPDSRSAYIIICNGRIEVDAAKHPRDRVRQIISAASRAAANLTTYYGERLTAEQSTPISDLQHEMMDNAGEWSIPETETKVTQMFALLNELEDAMAV